MSPPLVRVQHATDPRLAPFRLRERGLASRGERRDATGRGLFAAEGDLVFERALAAGCAPVAVLCREDRAGSVCEMLDRWTGHRSDTVEVMVASDELRREATGLGVPLDVVSLFERPPRASVDEVVHRATRLAVVEGVDNPTNLGAIVRNAVGLGWSGLLLDPSSADPLARRAVRTSMGTVFRLPWARLADVASLVDLIRRLTGSGTLTVALTPAHDAVDLRDVAVGPDERLLMAVGSERHGLDAAIVEACELRVRIPMAAGVDSLNVGAATAIACHHWTP